MKKTILDLVAFPTLMSAQFIAKKGFDYDTRSPYVTVNVAPAAKFSPADAIVADKPVFMSITSNRYKQMVQIIIAIPLISVLTNCLTALA
ncbi:MAG TPA: hypothetical protein VGB44_02030 [Flavobacterium sp.]|jgi:hypothetical protein